MNKEINLRQQLINCGVGIETLDKYIKQFIKDVYKKYDDKSNANINYSLKLGKAKTEIKLVAYVTIVENFKAYSLLSAESYRRLNVSLEEMFKNTTVENAEDVNKHLTNTSDRLRMAVEMSSNLEGDLVPKLIDDYFDEQLKIYRNNKKK